MPQSFYFIFLECSEKSKKLDALKLKYFFQALGFDFNCYNPPLIYELFNL